MPSDAVFQRFPRPIPSPDKDAPPPEGQSVPPFFGGDQEWFKGYIARLSGCGPVAAANLLACQAAADTNLAARLGVRPEPDGAIPLADYKAFMERVYSEVRTRQIRPLCDVVDRRHERAAALLASEKEADRERGRAILHSILSRLPFTFGNSARSLRRGVDRFAEKYHIPLLWRERKTRRLGYERGLAFIKEALGAGSPVILLNHLNRVDVYYHGRRFVEKPQKGENPTMHFMTIAALREDADGDPELVLSDGGCLATTSYKRLHASWQTAGTLGGSLLWFTTAQPLFEPLSVREEVEKAVPAIATSIK